LLDQVLDAIRLKRYKSSLSALLFLYHEVLNLDIADIDAVRAKRPEYMPTVLIKEAIAVIQ
jgi:hypothetical protein